MRLKRPDMLSGTPEQQTDQLRRYLFVLVEELERALDEIKKKEILLEKRIKEVDQG